VCWQVTELKEAEENNALRVLGHHQAGRMSLLF
jgi:hypothetical protein